MRAIARVFTFCLISGMALAACGKESLKDNLSAEQSRRRELTSAVMEQYHTVDGHYATDTSKDTSKYWMEISITAIPIQRDGSTEPQASLVGSVRTWLKGSDSAASKKATEKPAVFNFSNGIYDSGVLAFKIPGINTDGIQVSCTRVLADSFRCQWIPSGSAIPFDFYLIKVSGT